MLLSGCREVIKPRLLHTLEHIEMKAVIVFSRSDTTTPDSFAFPGPRCYFILNTAGLQVPFAVYINLPRQVSFQSLQCNSISSNRFANSGNNGNAEIPPSLKSGHTQRLPPSSDLKDLWRSYLFSNCCLNQAHETQWRDSTFPEATIFLFPKDLELTKIQKTPKYAAAKHNALTVPSEMLLKKTWDTLKKSRKIPAESGIQFLHVYVSKTRLPSTQIVSTGSYLRDLTSVLITGES